MNLNRVPVLEADYYLERFDDEITVYHPTLTTAVYLNETGALIWELCDGTRNIAEIIGLLEEAYPENRDQIQSGVVDIIAQLVEKKIVTLAEQVPDV